MSRFNVGDLVRSIRTGRESFISLKFGEEAYVWRTRDSFILEVRTPSMIAGRWGVVSVMSWEVELVEAASQHGMSLSDITALYVETPKPYVPDPLAVAFYDELVLIIENNEDLLIEARRIQRERTRLPARFGVVRRWERDFKRLRQKAIKEYLSARGEVCLPTGLPSTRGIKNLLDAITQEEPTV